MKKTLTRSEFHEYFTQSDNYKNHFSYDARNIIFDYLNEYEASTGEHIEFDLVWVCCAFEDSTIEQVIADYDYIMDDTPKDKKYIREFLDYRTDLCGEYETGGKTFLVYRQF